MLTEDYNVISVMSGTSLDGIDILHTNFKRNAAWEFKIIKAKTYPYSKHWKHKLSTLTQFSIDELKETDYEYSIYLAEILTDFISINSITKLNFIASHGHTALHNPEKGYTYQIGNQQVLADVLGVKIICDFRVQDVALGGQGAPLVPIGDQLLFSNYTYCINLGGFANISYQKKDRRIAFDICPVNIVLNYYVASLGFEFDANGDIAKSGTIHQPLLNALNCLDYYDQLPPKSLGLEWVQSVVFPIIEKEKLQIKDVLCTFVEHAAVQIAKAITLINAEVLVTGGGVYNSFLIERIRQHTLGNINIPPAQIIEFKEALIFGLLGVLKHRNEVNCLSSVTGAKMDHSSGKILIPKNHI